MPFRFLQRILPSGRTQRQLAKVGGGAFGIIAYPFRLVFGLAGMTGQVIASWWDSRNLRFLLQGLPALIVAIGLLVGGAMVFFQDKGALAQEYQEVGARALMDAQSMMRNGKEGKASLATAQTCYKRLSQISPSGPTPENTFHMAETYELQGQRRAADKIFEALSPLDPKKPSYGPAHFMVARWLLAGNPDSKQLAEAENHLDRAIHFNHKYYSPLARAMMFELLRSTNHPDEAEHELMLAARDLGDQDPRIRVKLTQWYMSTGKRDLAEKQIELASAVLEKKIDENIDDNESRVMLTQCLMLSGQLKAARGDFKKGKEEFTRSKSVCDRGRNLAMEPAMQNQYLLIQYRLLLTQYDTFERDPNKVSAEQFDLLERAMYITPPGDGLVLQRLINFIRMTGPEGDKTRKQFDDLLASGANSVIAHYVLGADAYNQGAFADAKYHWEKACDKTNGAPLIANNLAWVLSMKISPPDYERALALVETAIAKADAPEFHGTRGHILAKMGRYAAALPELEAAKTAYANNPKQNGELFLALADVREHLGMKADAARDRKRAEDLLKRPASSGQGGIAGPTGPLTPGPTPPAGAAPATADPKAPTGDKPAPKP